MTVDHNPRTSGTARLCSHFASRQVLRVSEASSAASVGSLALAKCSGEFCGASRPGLFHLRPYCGAHLLSGTLRGCMSFGFHEEKRICLWKQSGVATQLGAYRMYNFYFLDCRLNKALCDSL